MAHSPESPTSSSTALNPPKIPPCAQWAVWTGFEVEGTEDLGAPTLFIRSLVDDQSKVIAFFDLAARARAEGIRRVWFCEGFVNLAVIADATRYFEWVCMCLHINDVRGRTLHKTMTPEMLAKMRFYLKIGDAFGLRPGDFISFGNAYEDTTYQLSGGSDVTAELYEDDVCWFEGPPVE